MEEDVAGEAFSTRGRDGTAHAYNALVGKSERKRPFEA